MAAIDALQTAWTTEIAKISDALVSAEATYALERYVAAVQMQAKLEANDIQSYMISGRSVTRRNADVGQALINSLKCDLWKMVYGGVSLADMNTEVAQP